jgi:membrane protein DedA with SNARE-associated domain
MNGLEEFLVTYGLLAVFIVMLLKEIGIPVPIPGDVVMLGVAAQTAQGRFPLWLACVAFLVPMFIGGLFQFGMARGPGRRFIYRTGKFIGLTQARLDKMMDRVRRGGSTAVAFGLSVPGIRIATNPASGLANLSTARYIPGLIAGSVIFLGWHFAIGYAGGALLENLSVSTPVVVAIIAAVLAFGVLMAYLRRRRNQQKHSGLQSYAEWAQASCPVCATLTLLQDRHEMATPGP